MENRRETREFRGVYSDASVNAGDARAHGGDYTATGAIISLPQNGSFVKAKRAIPFRVAPRRRCTTRVRGGCISVIYTSLSNCSRRRHTNGGEGGRCASITRVHRARHAYVIGAYAPIPSDTLGERRKKKTECICIQVRARARARIHPTHVSSINPESSCIPRLEHTIYNRPALSPPSSSALHRRFLYRSLRCTPGTFFSGFLSRRT